MTSTSKRDPALKPTQTMGGRILTSTDRVIVEREEAETTTVDVPEGHAVTVRLKRGNTMTAVSLENSTDGWVVTMQGYGARLAHVETGRGAHIDYEAQNNAIVLDVDLNEVWNVAQVRAEEGMPCSERIQDVAARRYGAYTAQSGGLNFQGDQCPGWDDLPKAIQQNWIAVVDSEHRETMGKAYRAPHPDILPARE